MPATAGISGLQPQALYHFRIIAANVNGTAVGADQTFTTSPSPPIVETGEATDVTDAAATLNGAVNPNGADTTYHFDYGLTNAYGSATAPVGIGAGNAAVPGTFAVGGLTPETTYHFRIVATNAFGTTSGEDLVLTTDAAAAPPGGQDGTNPGNDPPVDPPVDNPPVVNPPVVTPPVVTPPVVTPPVVTPPVVTPPVVRRP